MCLKLLVKKGLYTEDGIKGLLSLLKVYRFLFQ